MAISGTVRHTGCLIAGIKCAVTMRKTSGQTQITQQTSEDDYLYLQNVVTIQGFTGVPTDKNCCICIFVIKHNAMSQLKTAHSCFIPQYFPFIIHLSLPMYTAKYELLIAMITKP
jgi:hypothetical protein